MKKQEMKEIVRAASLTKELCRMTFRYDGTPRFCFPFQVSDRLFLAADVDDFLLDGFSVYRFRDLTKVQIKKDKYSEILKAEDVLRGVSPPLLDLTDWYSTFCSLQLLNVNVIIEKESLDENEQEFAIGRIEKVGKNRISFRDFDAEGIWQDTPLEIPFSQITSVTFGSRYAAVFSRYV